MKKIGVCACYDTKNYGSMLQTLATCKAIECLGYDYEIIQYTRKPTAGLILRSLGRIPEKLKKKKAGWEQSRKLEKYPEVKAGIRKRNICFDTFMNTTFTKMSPAYDTFDQLRNAAQNYDAVLVGSDQLWLPQGFSTGFYNLMFVPDEIPKISYATSFGVSEIPDNKKKIAREFLNRMDYISVRELRASDIVKELTGREVPTVVDPTLLFNKNQWAELIPNQPLTKNQYIFCYFLGNNPEQRIAVRNFADSIGLPIVTIPHLDEFIESDVGFGDHEKYDVGPAEFVNLIRYAAYVCTDSFHGTVFSILHHKQFVTFYRFAEGDRQSRNSRIDSLLDQTGLQDRRVKSASFGSLTEIQNLTIDYNNVEERLIEMRESSMNYLTKALSDISPEEKAG